MPQNLFASIITIGDELLIGQTVDTNSAFIAQELNRIGIWVRRRVAVGDVAADIRAAMDAEKKESEVIIITGGLGPTADDITKPLLCEYFGGKLIVDQDVLAHVHYLFEKVYRRPGPILQRNLDQALVPDVCTVLHNSRGSAPGMWFSQLAPTGEGAAAKRIFISLPGVPHEMKGLMESQVIPKLLEEFEMPVILHRTAFTAGQGESMIAEQLKDFEASLPDHIKLAYLPGYGMVKLRLTSRSAERSGEDPQGDLRTMLDTELAGYFSRLLALVGEYLVTAEDEGLEVVVGKLFRSINKTLGTAESCTGGHLAQLITSVPGSSAYYKGGVISYANELKQELLGVKTATLAGFGAVSEATVREMVTGALESLQTDYAIATSGIMGPDGGTPEKPVGTIWIAVGNARDTRTLQLNLRFDRSRNTSIAALNALNFLRRFVLDQEAGNLGTAPVTG